MTVGLVKFVSADWETHGGQRWEVGTPVAVLESLRGTALCTSQVLHAYRSIEQALLMNPFHGDFGEGARVLRATAPDVVADDGTKVGVHEITLTEEVARPDWWTDPATRRRVQVQFAVLCARAVLHLYEVRYPKDDRPRKAVEAAEAYLAGKPDNTARAATYAAAAADDAAADAANAAATYAADAAADAANAAANAAANINFDTAALAAEAVKAERTSHTESTT